jgi:sulfate permease, SulP family
MPLNGSLSNTAINYESGGKTQLSGGFAAIIIILVLLFFASFFSNLPSAIIGVVIIASMVSLIDIKALRAVLVFDKFEFIFAVAAMPGVLFIGLLQGIFIHCNLINLQTSLESLFCRTQPLETVWTDDNIRV